MRYSGRGGGGIILKTEEELAKIARAGRVVSEAISAMQRSIVPDVTTTFELEQIAMDVIGKYGATSAFLGYEPPSHPPYPAWTCISVNEEVVHGLPGRRVLKSGDIVTCDVGVRLNGYFADGAWTVPVGEVRPDIERLLRVTKEALHKGIAMARPGNRVGDISQAVQRHVITNGYSIVREMVGHGVGRHLHEEPQVPNYGKARSGEMLKPGMTICIEPMVNMGKKEVESLPDEWTIVTVDRKPSAHFEHTVAITRNGPRILTQGE